MTGIQTHQWCFLPNIHEAPPQTEEINIIFVEQDGYKSYGSCSGSLSYDQTPLAFVEGSKGATTLPPKDKVTIGDIERIPHVDGITTDAGWEITPAGNIPKINYAKSYKMGSRGYTAPMSKRAGLYNPLNYSNLFDWIFYKYHEDMFCGLPDGRTYDNLIQDEDEKYPNIYRFDRGYRSYGNNRVYIKDEYNSDEILNNGWFFEKENAKQHNLIIQMDPRVIWNTHRTSMSLGNNPTHQYAEYPHRKTYYSGMGGVVGGSDALSPINFAAGNRSDYQKEAGTNFLPCCSRTDGSMSATCPYPVHARNFNFEEPVDRYPTLNDYFPGRASFHGNYASSGPLQDEGQSCVGLGSANYRQPVDKFDDKIVCGSYSGGESGDCITEKEAIEGMWSSRSLQEATKWYNSLKQDSTQFNSITEGKMYNFNFAYGRSGVYDYYDGDCCTDLEYCCAGDERGRSLYGKTLRPIFIDAQDNYKVKSDYYHNTIFDFDENFPIEEYGYRCYGGEKCSREWWGSCGPGWRLFEKIFGSGGDFSNGEKPPEDIINLFGSTLEKSPMTYYQGGLDLDISYWYAYGVYGTTAQAWTDGRTKWKKEFDIHERHPAEAQYFENVGVHTGGIIPPYEEWQGGEFPYMLIPGFYHGIAIGGCFVMGDAEYTEYGDLISGDPTTLTMGSCCWKSTDTESEFYGENFCFDPYYLSVGTDVSEIFSNIITPQGFVRWYGGANTPVVPASVFYAKSICSCIGRRENVEAIWHENTTCMLNDGTIDDSFPSYYTDYLGLARGSLTSDLRYYKPIPPNSFLPFGSFWGLYNAYEYFGDENWLDSLYSPSPCGGQYKIWPCKKRGPTWWMTYMINHYPAIMESSVGNVWFGIPATQHIVADGAMTWPDPRPWEFFRQFGKYDPFEGTQNIPGGEEFGLGDMEAVGDAFPQLNDDYLDSSVWCLKVPNGYGLTDETEPGVTYPYWMEVGGGDFDWGDCNWPWSRHDYVAHDYVGNCVGVPEDTKFPPTSPSEQKRMVGDDFPDTRDGVLQYMDSLCPGFYDYYTSNRPSPWDPLKGHSTSHNQYLQYGSYINDSATAPSSACPNNSCHSRLIQPTPPSAGLGNYSPHPALSAGQKVDSISTFPTDPKKLIRFRTWARWREWIPWTNFAPIIINHLERWIMPGRMNSIKKINVHLPKGIHAFGNLSDTSGVDVNENFHEEYLLSGWGDLYFPKNVTDYSFPIRGRNYGCKKSYDGSDIYSDEVPGTIDVEDTYQNVPNFPYGFDLSGTRKTLMAAVKRLANPEIEVQWILYPEKNVGRTHALGSLPVSHTGTAQTNSGIFLGELIYQKCAYGYYYNEDWNVHVYYDNFDQCLDFLDPYRICTDYANLYPNGYIAYKEDITGDIAGVPNYLPWKYGTSTSWVNPPMDSFPRVHYPEWTGPITSGGDRPYSVRYYENIRSVYTGSTSDEKDSSWYYGNKGNPGLTGELADYIKDWEIWENVPSDLTPRLVTPLMNHFYWLSVESPLGGLSRTDQTESPCKWSGYRPSLHKLQDHLYDTYPDLFSDEIYDLDPWLHPLRTFNTKKYLTGYYDVINEEISSSGGSVNIRSMRATGPPPREYDAHGEMVPRDTDNGWGLYEDRGFNALDDLTFSNWSGNWSSWEDLTYKDVMKYWLRGLSYTDYADEGQTLEDAMDLLLSEGTDPETIVWHNYNDPNGGGDGGLPPECLEDDSIDCDTWDYEDPDVQEEIQEGLGVSGGEVQYETLYSKYPNFWDNLCYGCASSGVGMKEFAEQSGNAWLGTETDYDHPFFVKYLNKVLSGLFWFFKLYDPHSKWRYDNGGCFVRPIGNPSNCDTPNESCEPWMAFLTGQSDFPGSESRQIDVEWWLGGCRMAKPPYTKSYIEGGLLCVPQNWNTTLSISTLWSPLFREINLYEFSISYPHTKMKPLSAPQFATPENLISYGIAGRQVLPPSLYAVTQRRKGGDHVHGFSYYTSFMDGFDDSLNVNELDGTYEVANIERLNELNEEGEYVLNLIDSYDFSVEEDIDKCGPPDAPYPCTARFIYPNTDITMIDKHGFKLEEGDEDYLEEYKPLRSSTKFGVGKPIEIAKDRHKLEGMGIHNSHGYGNTFDFRFGFPIDPIDCEEEGKKCYGPRDAFDGEIEDYGFTDYIRMVHYTGKELPKQLRDFTEGE